jgi:hypothetical protein
MPDLTWFDSSQVPDRNEPVPAGEYLAHIVDSKFVPVKSNPSINRLVFTIEILSEGKQKGRRIFEGLNCQHAPGTKAREIADETLKAICKAIGNPNPRNSEELHHKPFGIVVKVKAEEYNGATVAKNEIGSRGYKTAKEYRDGRDTIGPATDTPPWEQ